MVTKTYDKPLTAHRLAEKLLELPADTVVKWIEVDYDYDSWHAWAFRGVTQSGELLYGGIIEGGDLSEYMYKEED